MEMETAVGEDNEKRPRSEDLEISQSVDLGVEKERAQLRHPELKPQVEAHQSPAANGVDSAASAWVADGCNRALGQEFSPAEDERHAELFQALIHGETLMSTSREKWQFRRADCANAMGFNAEDEG